MNIKKYEQLTGIPLPDWQPAIFPLRCQLNGHYTKLVPLHIGHSEALFSAYSQGNDDSDWTWIRDEKPTDPAEMMRWLEGKLADDTLMSWGITELNRSEPLGLACYSHIDTVNGTLEIGPVIWSSLMCRTVLGTEAIYLLLKQAFTLGYRRVAWRCDSFNLASRRAAERLGFTFEGRSRQHMTCKNRNRDTDWLSIIDGEWPAVNQALSGWLSSDNFSADGKQKRRLESFRTISGYHTK